MGRIVAIGMSNTDLVCRTSRLPGPGETVAGGSLQIYAGGKGANQAVAASRAGAQVIFGGAVGDDTYGADRLGDLIAADIDVSLTQSIAGVPSGIAIIIVDERGENQIVTAAGANDNVDGALLVRQIQGQTTDAVMMTWELHVDTNRLILGGVNAGVPVILNLAPYDATIRGFFPDPRLIIVCNAVEASQLLDRPISAGEAIAAAREIQRFGCRCVILTLGGDGAVGADDKQSWKVPAPVSPVVDTTGAGDAFCGAFSAWLAGGATYQEATRAGVAAGACAVTVAGAQPSLPSRIAIERRMEEMAI